MLVLVTGGRDYPHNDIVEWALYQLDSYLAERKEKLVGIIHGAAQGVDSFADEWARKEGVLQIRCPGNPSFYGNKAFGPVRNRQMLGLKPDLVIAFPGGNGTKNMVATARKNGFKVWEPTENSIWDFMKPYNTFEEFAK